MPSKTDYVRSSTFKDDRHICHANGCTTKVKPALLMCARHWFRVPLKLRRLIWELYEPGQEITKDASVEYLDAVHQAIAAVEAKELA